MKTTPLTWNNVLDALSHTKYIVADTENDTRTEKRIPGSEVALGVALAGHLIGTDHVVSHYFPLRHLDVNIDQGTYVRLKALFEDSTKIFIFHNAKHDLVILEDMGIDTSRMNYYDTMLMEYTINGKQWSLRLDTISKKYGGRPKAMPPSMKVLVDTPEENKGWWLVPYELMRDYAINDAEITLNMFSKYLLPKFKPYEQHWEHDSRFIRVLNRMEQIGIGINKKICKEEYERGSARMGEIQWKEFNGLNPNSNDDLHELLIKQLGLRVLKSSDKTGKPSFDKKVMERYDEYLATIDSPVAKLVLEYRGWMKTTSSNYGPYLRLVNSDGRLRCNFNMHTTVTTRLSCDTPNLQQIPRMSEKDWNGNLESAFEPATGYELYKIDYSQLELRIIANDCLRYSRDFELIDILNDPAGDIFSKMAKDLGWKRQDVKTFVYMVSYGAGVNKIMGTFGVSREVASYMKQQFFETYPPIDQLFKECMSRYKNNGYIKLWTGRPIRNAIDDKPYAALDYRAQGGGAEIVKRKMNEIAEVIDWKDCKLVLQIHDAVVPEIRKGTEDKWIPIIENIMTEPIDSKFKVKFPVETKVWGKKEALV